MNWSIQWFGGPFWKKMLFEFKERKCNLAPTFLLTLAVIVIIQRDINLSYFVIPLSLDSLAVMLLLRNYWNEAWECVWVVIVSCDGVAEAVLMPAQQSVWELERIITWYCIKAVLLLRFFNWCDACDVHVFAIARVMHECGDGPWLGWV